MKVSELLEMLQELPGDCEVRLAQQPSYPLQMHLGGVVVEMRVPETEDSDEECEYALPGSPEVLLARADNSVVYLTEGSSVYDTPYASRRLWDV